ncbi:MAG: hypothetical protein KF726_16775, partial [Anaerolineae bacterium]|nr:hypothetical protein [Anaerolineae bacterium]
MRSITRVSSAIIRWLCNPLMVVTALAIALVVGIACNVTVLVRQQPPPTLQIRVATSTPLPTATPPGALPTEVAANPPVDPGVEALLEEVQTDSLMYTVYA